MPRMACCKAFRSSRAGSAPRSASRPPADGNAFSWFPVECVFYHSDQGASLERLPHAPVPGGRFPHYPLHFIGRVSRHQNDPHRCIQPFQTLGKFDATHSRHHYIDQGEIDRRPVRFKEAQRLLSVGSCEDCESSSFQRCTTELQDHCLIVDDNDSFGSSLGEWFSHFRFSRT